MPGDTTRLCVVNLNGGNGTDLRLFYVIEVDVVSGRVENGEEENGVGKLPVHPQVLVKGEKADLGPDPTHDSPGYGKQDEHTVDA